MCERIENRDMPPRDARIALQVPNLLTGAEMRERQQAILAAAARRMARGKFDEPVRIGGHDEYAGLARVGDRVYPAGISVGVPPTFPGATADFEAHLIGFAGDLYGQTVTVEFLERLRSQRSFASERELADAIAADLARVWEIAGE